MRNRKLSRFLSFVIFVFGATIAHASTFEYSGTVELCPDTGVPPFSVETVPRPGVELVQVISDAGGWTVALSD